MPYSDLNRGRYSAGNQIYSITTVTNDHIPLFHDFQAARILISEMRNLDKSKAVNSLAWVVMPDHLHWLFQLNHSKSLGDVIKCLKARSAHGINKLMARNGSVWQRAYYDRAARSDDDLVGIARYIVANPLRAGLVEHIGDYPHWDCVWL